MNRAEHEANTKKNLRAARAERKKAKERTGQDREVEKVTQTVQPGADPPSRAGITGAGSGADKQRS